MFAGPPRLARELENGTFRYAWTQGIGRVVARQRPTFRMSRSGLPSFERDSTIVDRETCHSVPPAIHDLCRRAAVAIRDR
jgi:hypothetical protein